MNDPLYDKARVYLNHLCLDISERCVGSAGNRAATDFFADRMRSCGFAVETPEFPCLDWVDGGCRLSVEGTEYAAMASPYTLGYREKAPLCQATTLAELRSLDARGKILLLSGEIAKEQLIPPAFPFYNPEEHQEINRLLEACGARAIIAATSRNPELAGGMYPFPLIENGDFDIPSAYMTEEEGRRLAARTGKEAALRIDARRIPATGCNVIAGKGKGRRGRVVICAHIDSKKGSPGAIDNATGIVILLLLAELLADYAGETRLEIVAINGEDYYSAPGEIQYLAAIRNHLSEIVVAINFDGAGYHRSDTAFSLYGCSPALAGLVRGALGSYPGLVEGTPWYQSDHGIFAQNGVPAVAVTSNGFMDELAVEITHTAKDHPDIVDCRKLVEIARAVNHLLRACP